MTASSVGWRLAAILLLVGCVGAGDPRLSTSYDVDGDRFNAEDRGLMSLILNNVARISSTEHRLTLFSLTAGIDFRNEWNGEGYFSFSNELDEIRTIPRDAFTSFHERNDYPVEVAELGLDAIVPSVDSAELDRLFEGGNEQGWRSLRGKLGSPCELLTISLPGYSVDLSTAVVFLERSRGPFASEGWLILLRRSDGGWEIQWSEIVVAS